MGDARQLFYVALQELSYYMFDEFWELRKKIHS